MEAMRGTDADSALRASIAVARDFRAERISEATARLNKAEIELNLARDEVQFWDTRVAFQLLQDKAEYEARRRHVEESAGNREWREELTKRSQLFKAMEERTQAWGWGVLCGLVAAYPLWWLFLRLARLYR